MRTLARIFALAAILACGACQRQEDRVVLRIANWGGAGDDDDFARTTKALYAEFEKANPGVEIRVEGIPGSQEYVSKMILNFVADAPVDIMILDASSAAIFIDNGVLMDLMPYIANDKEFSLEDYYPNVVDIGRRGEKLYAIPGDFTPMVMYYNRKLFDEAGVPFPQPGWTWADFLEKAKRLTKPEKKQYGFNFANWIPGWLPWLWNNDGDVLSPNGARAQGYFNGVKSVESVEFLRDLIEEHHVAASLSEAAVAGVDLFANGQAAMNVSGHWSMVGLKVAKGIKMEDVGVAELPSNRADGSVTVIYEAGFAVGRTCQNPELAWKFIKFMTSRDVQERYQSTGIAVCARKDVAESRAKSDPREQEFLRIIPSARAPWGSRVTGYDFVESAGQKAMDNVLGGTPAKVALDEAVRRIDGYFRIR